MYIVLANEGAHNAEAEAFGPFEFDTDADAFCRDFNERYTKYDAAVIELRSPDAERAEWKAEDAND